MELSELLKDRAPMAITDQGVTFKYDPSSGFCSVIAPRAKIVAQASDLTLIYEPTQIVLMLENASHATVGIPTLILDHLHGCTYTVSNEDTAKVLELARQDSEWIRQGRSQESVQQLAYLLEATAADRWPDANWLEVAEALKQIAPLSLKSLSQL